MKKYKILRMIVTAQLWRVATGRAIVCAMVRGMRKIGLRAFAYDYFGGLLPRKCVYIFGQIF